MIAPIEFYFDFISPYGYFGAARIESLAARYGRAVDWRPFLLGVTVVKIMGMRPLMETPLKSDYLAHDKPRLAKLLGVPFNDRDLSGESGVNAARGFLWLKRHHPILAVPYARRVFERLFVRGEDITAAESLADEAVALGVERPSFLEAIASPAMKDALRQSVDDTVARGVFGAPTFIVDNEPIWGADRLWMLEHWLQHGRWQPPRDLP